MWERARACEKHVTWGSIIAHQLKFARWVCPCRQGPQWNPQRWPDICLSNTSWWSHNLDISSLLGYRAQYRLSLIMGPRVEIKNGRTDGPMDEDISLTIIYDHPALTFDIYTIWGQRYLFSGAIINSSSGISGRVTFPLATSTGFSRNSSCFW